MPDTAPQTSEAAVLVTSRLIRAGREADFDRWAARSDAAAHAGSGGRAGFRLEQPGGLVHFVHPFDSEDAARRWWRSDERRRLCAEADAFSTAHSEIAVGDPVRVRLPSEADAPKWKVWLATWTAVFPILLLLNAAIRALPVSLPQPVQLALTSLVMTAALTWFVMPRVRRLLRPWLLRDDRDGSLRKDPG